MAADSFRLERFLEAQRGVYSQVCRELEAGRKTSHWIWFIFPQLQGLGNSATSRRYAISGREEAVAYAAHPVLGARLTECASLVCELEDQTIDQILGYPDDVKFRSSMTLFAHIAPENPVFREALEKYFAGRADQTTLDLLAQERVPER